MIYPNQELPKSTTKMLILSQIILFFLFWIIIGFKSIPSPLGIIDGFVQLYEEQNLVFNFITSTVFCIKCIFIGTVISLLFSYLSIIPITKFPMKMITKLRFLGTLGISFYVLTLVGNVDQQKVILMTFSIGVFLVTAIQSEISSPSKDEKDYGKTLGFSPWKLSLEINILSRLDKVWEIMRQNFAIAWVMLTTVEYLMKSSGGIGVLLVENNKYKHLEQVWALQIIIILTGMFIDWLFKKSGKFIFSYSSLYK